VGEDFDETLLRRMADAGGGNFQFIESAAQITDFVAGEVGEALATTVREAVLVVDAGPGATVESLNDFPCRPQDAPGASPSAPSTAARCSPPCCASRSRRAKRGSRAT
jgi:hypothetical protein